MQNVVNTKYEIAAGAMDYILITIYPKTNKYWYFNALLNRLQSVYPSGLLYIPIAKQIQVLIQHTYQYFKPSICQNQQYRCFH
jgi:hypothetical protein